MKRKLLVGLAWVVLLIALAALYTLARHDEQRLVRDDAIGKLDVQEEWRNDTANYIDADYLEYETTGAFYRKGTKYVLVGFSYNDKYYSKSDDCDDAGNGYEEEFHLECRRDDDEQNLYVRLTETPDGAKIPHPQVTNAQRQDDL